MRDVFSLEPTTIISPDASYIVSYPYLLSYFANKPLLGAEDVVRGAHMVYGWMPTILDLYPNANKIDLDTAAQLLTKAKVTQKLDQDEIKKLACLVNNSLVGATKLLHFVAPFSFAIWDSKVYSFIYEEKPYNHRVNKVDKYFNYLEKLRELQKDTRFTVYHSSINAKVGYDVSALRALELVMFLNSPIF
jgi:hypothetical protein